MIMATSFSATQSSYFTTVCPLLGFIFLTSYLGACDGILVDNGRLTTDDNTTQPEVTLPLGTVRGLNMETRNNRTVSGFIGIPFGQPPIGDLRFAAPVPASSWNETLNASQLTEPILCSQLSDDGVFEGVEDCLYLNVFTPELPSTENSTLLPVMVYLIGGAFRSEKNAPLRFGPDFILDKDVVLVIPNFRVGVLGFLSTGDEVSPGNYGLKDTVLALKWVQENIKYFGGDADQVTLFGGSSGGMSVHLLAISDSTNGLFHKIISQSGSALSPRFTLPRDVYANRSMQLGEYLGCPTNTSTVLVNCLRTINVSVIIDAYSMFTVWNKYPNTIWAPTSEPDIEGALLTDTPANLIAAGKMHDLPWMNVVTWDEGFTDAMAYDQDPDLFQNLLDKIDLALPVMMDYKDCVDDETAYTAALKAYYLNDLSANTSILITNVTQMYGDAVFVYPAYNAMKKQLLVAKNALYFAVFNYHGTFSKTYSLSGGSTKYTGVPHGEEIVHLFPYHDTELAPSGSVLNADDVKMINTMVQLWTSFAINGTPTTSESSTIWEPYSSLNNYLIIGNGSDSRLEMQQDIFIERIRFWEELTASSHAFRHSVQVLSLALALCRFILYV